MGDDLDHASTTGSHVEIWLSAELAAKSILKAVDRNLVTSFEAFAYDLEQLKLEYDDTTDPTFPENTTFTKQDKVKMNRLRRAAALVLAYLSSEEDKAIRIILKEAHFVSRLIHRQQGEMLSNEVLELKASSGHGALSQLRYEAAVARLRKVEPFLNPFDSFRARTILQLEILLALEETYRARSGSSRKRPVAPGQGAAAASSPGRDNEACDWTLDLSRRAEDVSEAKNRVIRALVVLYEKHFGLEFKKRSLDGPSMRFLDAAARAIGITTDEHTAYGREALRSIVSGKRGARKRAKAP